MGGVTVVKVGGNEVEDAGWVRDLALRLASARPVVVVHGGGREVSALQAHFGVEPEWRDGLRVSSADTVRIAAMVLSGVVNKRLVSALLTAGADAIGLSGEDGALIMAEPALDGALGRTGVVAHVRADLLRALLAIDLVPVISPISRGDDGAPFNVNADDAAAAVAAALGAGRLLFVSNVAGVVDGDAPVRQLAVEETEAAIASGVITGGMAPKVRAAARAAAAGVGDVRIGDLDLLSGGAGTRVLARATVLA
ncbi:MAG TPA: acetylglutamate kinase [Longimicrobiales bacterium]